MKRMSTAIKEEIKKHFPDIEFKVKSEGNGWYCVNLNCPAKTIEEAKQSLSLMDNIHKTMNDFESANGIIITLC